MTGPTTTNAPTTFERVIQTTRLVCLRCEHRWLPRVGLPARCPRCKSYLWDKPREAKGRVDDDDAI